MSKSVDLANMNILVVRPDRIGDVVLSTPVFEAIKRKYPSSSVFVFVHESVKAVVEHSTYLSGVITYKPKSEHRGLRGFFRLVKELRSHKFNSAVILQVQFRVTLAILIAAIRHRIGPFSKWYSYLFFNRGFRQSRSRVEMHEADYNLMLLKHLGIRYTSREFLPQIVVDAEAKDRAREYLKKTGLDIDLGFVAVHPGMGGSALNWPEGYYIDLVQRLAIRGVQTLVTGSLSEKKLVENVIAVAMAQIDSSDIPTEKAKSLLFSYVGLNSPSGLSDFIGILSLSKLVVAPSTGPLHIATALGKPTLSFFSPIKVQSALRWGPYVSDDSKHSVLVPDALCGQDFKCAGQKCHFYFCMERVSVEEAYRSIVEILD